MPAKASEELIVRRRTRRRVLSDDDFRITQVLLAFSLASRRVVLVASGGTPRSGPDRSDSGDDGDATQFAHHGGQNDRGLVREVAPWLTPQQFDFTSRQCRGCFGAQFVSACI